MCRLFGLYANKNVDVRFSFYKTPRRSFALQSYKHYHGWGIAWFDGVQWQIYKEPKPLYESDKARALVEKVVRGKIIISHIRHATVRSYTRGDTHPWLYRGYVFAHNGSIDRCTLFKLLKEEYRENLEGETDSEVLFRLIVQETSDLGNPVEGIKNAIEKITKNNIHFTSLNFILSDGEKLYALRCAETRLCYYTLYYIKRPKEGLELGKPSKETEQLISTKLSRGEKAVVIASEIMSDEPYWEPIPNKYLAVVNKNLDIKLEPIEL